jgi:hypothetical protein
MTYQKVIEIRNFLSGGAYNCENDQSGTNGDSDWGKKRMACERPRDRGEHEIGGIFG